MVAKLVAVRTVGERGATGGGYGREPPKTKFAVEPHADSPHRFFLLATILPRGREKIIILVCD
jgi:hypothetical protein